MAVAEGESDGEKAARGDAEFSYRNDGVSWPRLLLIELPITS